MPSIRCIRCGLSAGSTREITRVVLLAGFSGRETLRIMSTGMSDYRLSVSQMAARGLNSHGVCCPNCQGRSVWEAN
jgi:hypothetical protein